VTEFSVKYAPGPSYPRGTVVNSRGAVLWGPGRVGEAERVCRRLNEDLAALALYAVRAAQRVPAPVASAPRRPGASRRGYVRHLQDERFRASQYPATREALRSMVEAQAARDRKSLQDRDTAGRE
jgi:hypothetical protein